MDKIVLASLALTSLAVFGLPGYLLYSFHRLGLAGVKEAFRVCLLMWVLWIGFVAFVLTAYQEKQTTPRPMRAEAKGTVIALEDGGGFGGKRAQNRKNRKSKKLQKKNGIGLIELERRDVA